MARAPVLTRPFIEALDARDVRALVVLVAQDAEVLNPAGESRHGRDALRADRRRGEQARVCLFRRLEERERPLGERRVAEQLMCGGFDLRQEARIGAISCSEGSHLLSVRFEWQPAVTHHRGRQQLDRHRGRRAPA